MPIISLSVVGTNDIYRRCLGESIPEVILEVLFVLL